MVRPEVILGKWNEINLYSIPYALKTLDKKINAWFDKPEPLITLSVGFVPARIHRYARKDQGFVLYAGRSTKSSMELECYVRIDPESRQATVTYKLSGLDRLRSWAILLTGFGICFGSMFAGRGGAPAGFFAGLAFIFVGALLQGFLVSQTRAVIQMFLEHELGWRPERMPKDPSAA